MAATAKQFVAKVDRFGRLLIPAELRRCSGFIPGTAVTLSAGEIGEIRVRSRAAAVRGAQALFEPLRRPGQLWSEELMAERRREARREYGR